MGVNLTHALGRKQKVFAKEESAAGTFVKPAATDALKAIKVSMPFSQERKDRMDSRTTRSVLERISGKKSATWSIEKYIIPSGTAGTPPDDHVLWKAGVGGDTGYTNTGSTSDEYALASSQTLETLSIVRHLNDIVMESVKGAVVEEIKVVANGGDEPKVNFSGFAMGHVHTGYTTLDGDMVSSDQMTVDDHANIEIDSVVKIDSDDNSGAGYKVTAGTTSPYTLETTLSASDGVAVTPFTPSETTAGSPINGITGSTVIDTVTFPILAFELTLKNNIKAVEDEAQQAIANDFIPGFREVTGKISVRARRDFIIELGKRKSFSTRDVRVTLGAGSGTRLQIDVDYAEFEFEDFEVPESEEAIISLPFKALGSSGDDEVKFTFL